MRPVRALPPATRRLRAAGLAACMAAVLGALPGAVGAASLAKVTDAAAAAAATPGGGYRALPGGQLRSVLPADGVASDATVAPFQMRTRPVSNGEYRDFIRQHPEWAREQAPALFVAPTYLAGWGGATDPAPLSPDAPVVRVSWYAASAFCASEGARLPRWYEWEFAAAADATRADARDDPAWLARILDWYSAPGNGALQSVAAGTPNYYGLHDMHGLVWEWVEDFNGLFVNADSRARGEQKLLDYCGGAAVSLADRRNYAVLMRLALLAAMESQQDGANLGFRCARDAAP